MTPRDLVDRVVEVLAGDDTSVVWVAAGGGADSAVLAATAVAAADGGRIAGAVRLVHVDHDWEGSASLRAAVRRLADALDVPLEIRAAASAAPSETAGRAVRYAALDELAPGPVLLGHHADDTVETVVTNLLRGTGTAGLGGIPGRRDRYRRPFLDVRRVALRDIAVAEGLPFVDDPANVDDRHLRARIRKGVVPVLETASPGAVDHIAVAARHAAADDALIDTAAAEVPMEVGAGMVALPIPVLATVPDPVAMRALRRAFVAIGATVDAAAFARVGAVVSGERAATQVAPGVDVRREGPLLTFTVPTQPRSWAPAPLQVPGRVTLPDGTLAAATALRPPVGSAKRRAGIAPRLAGSLVVRPAAPGDRIDIGSGHKRVVTALAEAGVPARRRVGWPVVVASGKIAWIPGARSAPWATVRRGPVIEMTWTPGFPDASAGRRRQGETTDLETTHTEGTWTSGRS